MQIRIRFRNNFAPRRRSTNAIKSNRCHTGGRGKVVQKAERQTHPTQRNRAQYRVSATRTPFALYASASSLTEQSITASSANEPLLMPSSFFKNPTTYPLLSLVPVFPPLAHSILSLSSLSSVSLRRLHYISFNPSRCLRSPYRFSLSCGRFVSFLKASVRLSAFTTNTAHFFSFSSNDTLACVLLALAHLLPQCLKFEYYRVTVSEWFCSLGRSKPDHG